MAITFHYGQCTYECLKVITVSLRYPKWILENELVPFSRISKRHKSYRHSGCFNYNECWLDIWVLCTRQLLRIPEVAELGSRTNSPEEVRKHTHTLLRKEARVTDLHLAKVLIYSQRGKKSNKDREGPHSQNYSGETIM